LTQEEINELKKRPRLPGLEKRLEVVENTILDLMSFIAMGGI